MLVLRAKFYPSKSELWTIPKLKQLNASVEEMGDCVQVRFIGESEQTNELVRVIESVSSHELSVRAEKGSL